MSILAGLIIVATIGGVVGWLAGLVVNRSGPGILGDVVLGIAGAVASGFVLPNMGVCTSGSVVSGIVASAAGATGLVLILRLLQSRRRS